MTLVDIAEISRPMADQHWPAKVVATSEGAFVMAAFDVGALGQLLSVIGQDQMLAALTRAREMMQLAAPASTSRPSLGSTGGRKPLSLLFIRASRQIHAVSADEISRFEGSDDYVTVHARGRRLLAAARMNELESLLDPDRFIRVHRSHIVNLGDVTSIVSQPTGRLLLTMRDGAQVFASRQRSRLLRRQAF